MFSATLVGMSPRPALDPALLSHLISAQRLEDRRGRRSSGIAALDRLLGGGWPRAALCELVGRRSSGRTAILYAALARAHRGGRGGGAGRRRRRAGSAARVRRRDRAAPPAVDPLRGRCGGEGRRSGAGRRRVRSDRAGSRRCAAAPADGGLDPVQARGREAGDDGAGVRAGARGRMRAPRPSSSSAPGAPRFVADGAPLFAGLRAKAVRGRGGHEPEQLESEEARCASLAFSCRS